MDAACIATPFGRRAMTLALLARHGQVEDASPDIKRNKWKLFRSVCEARGALDISDRSLTVLDALLSFYPSDELSSGGPMIVFPSNTQLSIRARGMTPATLRRHLAALVDAGLILRKDSPNGKRYARRGRGGDVSEAFGFSLAPLVARAEEIEAIAMRIGADKELVRSMREKISLCRREITKLIQLGQNTCMGADWIDAHDRFRSFLSALPRRPSLDELRALLTDLTDLRGEIINTLRNHIKTRNICTNESQNERHIQDSQTYSQIEQESGCDKIVTSGQRRCSTVLKNSDVKRPKTQENDPPTEDLRLSLDMVLRACPDVTHYGPGGCVRTWKDLVQVSTVLCRMLKISASALQEAWSAMGPQATSVVIACIYSRGGAIASAGAYLRNLSKKAQQKQFSVLPMLAALLRPRPVSHSIVPFSKFSTA